MTTKLDFLKERKIGKHVYDAIYIWGSLRSFTELPFLNYRLGKSWILGRLHCYDPHTCLRCVESVLNLYHVRERNGSWVAGA